MQETKINLEEIYNRFNYISRVETDSSNIDFKGNMIKAMKEACLQALELAAKNAKLIEFTDNWGDPDKYLDKQSILNTINQIE